MLTNLGVFFSKTWKIVYKCSWFFLFIYNLFSPQLDILQFVLFESSLHKNLCVKRNVTCVDHMNRSASHVEQMTRIGQLTMRSPCYIFKFQPKWKESGVCFQVENVQRGEGQVAHRLVMEEKKPTPPPAPPTHAPRPPSLPPSIPAQHSQLSPPIKHEVKESITPPKLKPPRPGETNGMNQMSTLPRLPLPNFSGDMDGDNSPARFVHWFLVFLRCCS